jgi:hypothetical protein
VTATVSLWVRSTGGETGTIHCVHVGASLPSTVHLGDFLCSVFNDGFPNVFVRDALDIRNKNVAFLCSFHEPAVIFEQISVIYALPRLFISSFTLVLPFFPTGTLERVRLLTLPA